MNALYTTTTSHILLYLEYLKSKIDENETVPDNIIVEFDTALRQHSLECSSDEKAKIASSLRAKFAQCDQRLLNAYIKNTLNHKNGTGKEKKIASSHR